MAGDHILSCAYHVTGAGLQLERLLRRDSRIEIRLDLSL